MPPQFGRVLSVSVMAILVALFTWIYHRDRQQRVRLWMMGWMAIMAHFGAGLADAYHLIPPRLADWLAYTTLLTAAACFYLSITQLATTARGRALYLGGFITPAALYWTCLVFDVHAASIYRGLLIVVGASAWLLMMRDPQRRVSLRVIALTTGLLPAFFAGYKASAHPEYGMDLLMYGVYASIGFGWWRHYQRASPGIVAASASFLAWGLVFPLAELLGAIYGDMIPADHVVWDLPK